MDADDFVTLSINREVDLSAESARETVMRRFLSYYVDTLREGGCAMVGHIKGMLADGQSPPLFFSVTSLDGDVQFKGGPLREKSALSLSMTVIVAGISKKDATALLETALNRYS